MSLFSDRLPDRRRRRIRVSIFGFRRRMLLFFVAYTVMFGVYVGSFVLGSDFGLSIEEWAKGLNGAVFGWIASLVGGIGNDTLNRIMDGFVRVMTSDFVAVIVAIMIIAIIIMVVVSGAVAVVRTVKANIDEKPHVYMENGWDERYEVANGTVAPKL